MRYPQVRFGEFTSAATPVAVTVDLGFVPDYVRVLVVGTAQYELMAREGSGKGIKEDDVSTYHIFLTTGGLELVDTETIDTDNPVRKTKIQGFRVPAALQVASTKCIWMAIRES